MDLDSVYNHLFINLPIRLVTEMAIAMAFLGHFSGVCK